MQELPEVHKEGIISIENKEIILKNNSMTDVLQGDFGIQIAADGRVWICINGIAFLRFKPFKSLKTFGG